MKKLKQFLKNFWKFLEEPKEEPYPYWKSENKDLRVRCPYCGYIGNYENVSTHLLKYHYKVKL